MRENPAVKKSENQLYSIFSEKILRNIIFSDIFSQDDGFKKLQNLRLVNSFFKKSVDKYINDNFVFIVGESIRYKEVIENASGSTINRLHLGEETINALFKPFEGDSFKAHPFDCREDVKRRIENKLKDDELSCLPIKICKVKSSVVTEDKNLKIFKEKHGPSARTSVYLIINKKDLIFPSELTILFNNKMKNINTPERETSALCSIS